MSNVVFGYEARKVWHEYIGKRKAKVKDTKRIEFPGRSLGKPHGTFVTDIAERSQGIILCSSCVHKFNPNKYNYYLTKEFRIQGRCDACKEHTQGTNFFIHDSLIGQKHGQCWKPR